MFILFNSFSLLICISDKDLCINIHSMVLFLQYSDINNDGVFINVC